MTYTRSELDSMERDAHAMNAASALRCPIATALATELAELIRPEYDAQHFGERWSLLERAERACFEAQQMGRDLQLVGDGPLDAWDVATVALFAREMA